MWLKNSLRSLKRGLLWSSGLPQEFSQIAESLRQPNLQPACVDRGTQLLLRINYRNAFEKTQRLLDFDQIEFRSHSQNGEDGILWYIFSLIGTVNKKVVEICASDGIQCNAANLIINDGWAGLLFDGNDVLIKKGQEYYKTHPDTFVYPPKLCHAWITAENVNELITANGFRDEIDLLSLDIDGIDYWLFSGVSSVGSIFRDVLALQGTGVASGHYQDGEILLAYRPDFKAEFVNGFGVYCGASLPAFVKLGKKKGYRLVGCQRYGFNAFFIRDDVGQDVFAEISAERCLSHPFAVWAHDELRPMVINREWQEV